MRLYFTQARSAVVAQGMVLDLIHRYKYRKALWLEPFLARLLVDQAAPLLGKESWDMIVPVPLHPSKLVQREFNQAERLAQHLSRATGLPLNPHLLRRVRDTETQTHLNRVARQTNMWGSFTCPKSAPLRGRRCIVLDDVFTTGATTNACARALKSAGAREISIWTLARGLIR
jgi:ComF family protein